MFNLIKLVLVCSISMFAFSPSFALDANTSSKTPIPSKANTNKSIPVLDKVSQQALTNKIDLNKATALEIAKFNGFGPKRSQAIIDYRNAHGVFKSFNDLSLVQGISKRFIEKNLEKLQQTFVI